MLSIKIMGHDYQIREVEEAEINGYGQLRIKSQEILYSTGMPQTAVLSTILHEVIEAANYHLEFEMPHPVIMGLEAVLFQTLVDNPQFVDEIRRACKDG